MGEAREDFTHACQVMADPMPAYMAERLFRDDHVLYRVLGGRYWDRAEYPRCELANCAMCGRLSAKRRLVYAWFPHLSRTDYTWPSLGEVCLGCNSKVSVLHRNWDAYREIHKLINGLREAIRDAAKAENHGRPSGCPP
jgi:hypothetical protein